MKKSEKYQVAMIAVLTNNSITATDKLEIIEELLGDKSLAEYTERREEENNAESV